MGKSKYQADKRKYDIARHHAWAGSVLLAVILALRLFIEPINVIINTVIYVAIACVILYVLISLVFTYRYRSAIFSATEPVETVVATDEKDDKKVTKDQLKVKKKQAKNEYKIRKKQEKEKK